ncbi:MAG: PadR family transcriptional regulator [Candidatus Dormibacteria bacterium]
MSASRPVRLDDGQPRNLLRAWLLLLLSESPAHGYDLVERLDEVGAGRDAGGLYRALRSLEHEGLVSSSWEASLIGPDRRCYAVTDLGRLHLVTWSRVVAGVRESLGLFLDRYREMANENGR